MRKLLFLFVCLSLTVGQIFAQSHTIKGKVTDDKGAGIPNASILVKGTTIGTTSESDGTFSLNVPATAKTLVIASLNFSAQEISIGSKTVINTVLQTTTQNLEEVVVVGYGTQKKSEATASVAKISGAAVANRPLSSVDQILQGKAAGVQSVTFSGQPGANQQVRIRGISSLSLSSQPLYVVDGIIINTGDVSRLTTTTNVLAQINPDDIESISILKDAAATAIYGSQGANGVIVISTKRGKAGKTEFSFTAELGQNTHGDIPATGMPLRSKDWLALFQESYVNAGGTPAQAATAAANYGDGSVDIDWLGQLTRTGPQAQYNLSARGGDEKTKFYISGGYFNQVANVIGSDLKRYSSVINIDHTISKKFSVSINLQPTYTRENAPLSNSSAFSNPVMEFYFLRPTQNPYNADGTYNVSKATKDFSSTFNPLYIIANDIHSADIFSVNGKVKVNYNILKGLNFNTSIGGQYQNLEEYYYNNPVMGDGAASNGRGYAYYTRYFLYDAVNQLDYHTNFLKDFSLDATGGYEAIDSKSYGISAQSNNFATPLLTSAGTAATPITASNTESDYSFTSLFSRVNLSYRGKYNLQGSFRRDGSSKFSAANQYGNFWAVSGSWNISKEDFMANVKAVSDLKLRASYGQSGNSAGLGNYGWRQTFGFGANYNGQPGDVFNGVGAATLKWETAKQTDIGLDVSFFKNRLNVVFDYYNKNIDGLIFSVPLSLTTGFASANKNIGAMTNSGIELTINATPVKTKNFQWDLSFNFTHNKNELKTLPAGQRQILSGQFQLQPGYDVYTFYMRQWAGVDPANGNPLWYTDSSKSATTASYNSASRVSTGKTATPKYYGGLSNTFTYRQFSVSFDLYYNYGNYVQDAWAAYLTDDVNPSYGKYTSNLRRWTTPGQVTDVPKLVYGSTNFSNSASTRFLYKGDFIRLRNITLQYAADKALASKLHVSALSFYVRGTNLWTKVYDNTIPFDPEQNINSQSNLNLFYNKSVTVGINVGF